MTERPSDEVDALIAQLDDDSEAAEEAEASLIAIGVPAAERLVHRLAGLSPFGKLCAIEVLTAVPVPGAGEPLTRLLGDENSTVREWAALALGELGHVVAVGPLRRLHDRLLDDAVPLDWTEPVAVRRVLTELGARHPVVPPLLRQLAVVSPHGEDVWPATELERVVDALAGAGQVVLYFSTWRQRADGHLYWHAHDRAGWTFDRDAAWEDNVRAAREAALLEASTLPDDRDGLLANVEWIDAADLVPLRDY